MRKLIIAVIIGITLVLPISVLAREVSLPWTNNIYRVSDTEDRPTVSVFDDADNKCYVLSNRNTYSYPDTKSISCVKR